MTEFAGDFFNAFTRRREIVTDGINTFYEWCIIGSYFSIIWLWALAKELSSKLIKIIKIILPPNQFRCPICLGTVIKNDVGSIKKGK